MQGLPENLNDESFIDSRYPSLIVIHDLMRDATNSKDVCELFGEGVIIGISVLHAYCRTASQREKKTEPGLSIYNI